jgi:hypothetical protein
MSSLGSNKCNLRVFAILPYLGGNQGRETSAGDVAHLVWI